ncbi:MAG: thioredoxin family protein [Planctomycetaceae bacterium]
MNDQLNLWLPVVPCRLCRLAAILMLAVLVAGCSGAPESSVAASSAAAPAAAAAPAGAELSEPAGSAESASSVESTAPVALAGAAVPADQNAAVPAAPAARAPIYLEEPNGKQLIAAALERARQDHKHVLIEWGGNWCGWCYKLHDVFHNDAMVQPVVHEEFELVLIDQGQNKELMLEYAGAEGVSGFPHLTILDAGGALLTNQETGSLETGSRHDPQRVTEFLRKWVPPQQDAEQLLSGALAKAGSEQKAVLVRVGSPYCGWCTVLSRFMQQQQSVFAIDYVDLKIDTLRMLHGESVAAGLQPAGAEGIPWMVILDASGKTLATSIGPEGNIGYPYQPAEIAHFLSMLKSTRSRLTDAQLESIAAELTAWRVSREEQ